MKRSLEQPPVEEEIEKGGQTENAEGKEAARAEILSLKGELVEKFKEAETNVRLKLRANEWLSGVSMITERKEDAKTKQKLALRKNWNFIDSQHPFSGPDSNDLKLEREHGSTVGGEFGGSRIAKSLERLVLNENGAFYKREVAGEEPFFSKVGQETGTTIENPEELANLLKEFIKCLDSKECKFVVSREMSSEAEEVEPVKVIRGVGVGAPPTEEVTSLPEEVPVPHKKSIYDEPTIKG